MKTIKEHTLWICYFVAIILISIVTSSCSSYRYGISRKHEFKPTTKAECLVHQYNLTAKDHYKIEKKRARR